TYAPSAVQTAFVPAPAETQDNVAAGFLGRTNAFVDLFGEGLPGILTEIDGAWLYKPNLGAGRFGAQTAVLGRPAGRPAPFAMGGVNGDGNTDVFRVAGRTAGRFSFDRDERRWNGFQPFADVPHLEALGGRVHTVDLNGDGLADLVVAKGDRVVWFASEGD